ncbi:MAG: translation initiation factor IF-2 [Planctomycetota bacterium]|nr:translation initiation factor IF-2 [Planctomycetota bacterium]
MPVRIYALAKEINVDSKDLVEICRKAGVSGKGSALASLTDEEVTKVRAFLSGGEKKKVESAAEAGPVRGPAMGRPSVGRPPVIRSSVSHPPQRPSEPVPIATSDAPLPDEPEPTATSDVPLPSELPSEPAPYTRGDYIAPGAGGKSKVLDVSRARPGEKPKEKKEESDALKGLLKKKREPVIKLAEMPQVQQPAPTVRREEPKAQRPEIRLPKDAIAGHRAGQRPPLEHLTKSLEKKPEPVVKKPEPPKDAKPHTVEAPLSGKGAGQRKGKSETDEEGAERGLAGMASARADRQKTRKSRVKVREVKDADLEDPKEAPTVARRPKTLFRRRGTVNTAAPRREKVALELPCTVRTFSEASGVSAAQVLKKLLDLGRATLNINAQIDDEMAHLLVSELGVDVEFKQFATLEDSVIDQIVQQPESPEDLQPRPPIVTFLGHVDHGKTSLLDRIIGINVVSGEAGGITQHIRAYQIEKDGRKIAFVDTPGHEAFTEMRARGANVTDIAVLVIAADDGVMPQTEEAISHAKAANVPIIVALNKIDLPAADANRAMQQLTGAGLLPSEWGGDVEVVKTSATKGDGIDVLLENILLTAELNDYRANPNRPAQGVCLEAEQQSGRGVIAKLIVKNGTLRVGDIVLCGTAYGRVKSMHDTLKPRQRMQEAGPSTPANVTGFDQAPQAGDKFFVLADIIQAREIAARRETVNRQKSLSGLTKKVSFEEFQRRLSTGKLLEGKDVVTLNLILRTDVRGSIEAIEKELEKLEHPEVRVHILHKSVGAITAGDVTLAHASDAVIIGFNVVPDEAARALSDDKQVEIRRYDIIYKVTDDIKALLEGKLKPEERVVELGHAVVKRVFAISRVGAVAGCYVVKGTINRGCRIRVSRDGRIIGDYDMESLRRDKDDVREVPRGMECGIKLAGFNDIKQDDILEAYRIEEVARTL